MHLFDDLQKLQRLDALLRRKSPGTANDLACQLGISRRSLFRLFDQLRSFGAEIVFCRKRKGYYYAVLPEVLFDPPPKKIKNFLPEKSTVPGFGTVVG